MAKPTWAYKTVQIGQSLTVSSFLHGMLWDLKVISIDLHVKLYLW